MVAGVVSLLFLSSDHFMLACGGSVVVHLLFYVPPIVCGGSVLVFVLVCIPLCPF